MSITYTLRRRDSRSLTAAGSGVTFTVATGPRGATGPAPSGTGLVRVIDGTASTLTHPSPSPAGSYTLASITVDAFGRVTAASSGSGGTVTSTDITDSTATGRAVLTAADAAAARTAIGAGTGSGDAVTSGTLGQFAATTSAQLALVLTDETGSGAAVFGTGPTLTSPVIAGAATTGILFGGSASTDVLLRKNAAVGSTPNLAVYSGNIGSWAVVSAMAFRAGTDSIQWVAGGTGQWAALNDAQTAFVGIKGSNLTATALVNLGPYTVATLPSAASNTGALARVSDSSVAASGNYGATVAAGGANVVKVFSNGTNWVIA